MLFNSLQFLVFFPVVTALYFALPHRYRCFLLLAASCIFYMAFVPKYILILAVTIVVDFIAGMYIEKTSGHRRKLFLIVSIVANVGFLAFFKYFNFLNGNIAALANFLHWNYSIKSLSIILPIGLSFHTFQAMSYTIEVYRGNQAAEKNFFTYALYVMFFPQLVAGPIERPQNLLHQFKVEQKFEYDRVVNGLKTMLWGFFKKIVLADRLALIVNTVYGNYQSASGPVLIIATAAFALQIYYDFAGYSDIAIGSARVLGIKLMENFDRPYSAQSVAEFWRRWHISLSSWFKDYVYFPMGGNRVSLPRRIFNTMVVFLLSGLWHGANWTFIIWGAIHGLYISVGIITKTIREKIVALLKITRVPLLHKIFKTTITFILVSLAWVFFRSENFGMATYIIKHLFLNSSKIWEPAFVRGMVLSESALGVSKQILLILGLSLVIIEVVTGLKNNHTISAWLAARPAWFRWLLYYGVVGWILFFGYFGKGVFIYFQF